MGHLAQSKIPFIYNFSQVLFCAAQQLTYHLRLMYRPWCPSLSTGGMQPQLPDSKPCAHLVAHEVFTRTFSWFLDNPELNWTPPQKLLDFIAKARHDGKPLVYIGFGSITVPDPKLVTERLIRAVQKSKHC